MHPGYRAASRQSDVWNPAGPLNLYRYLSGMVACI